MNFTVSQWLQIIAIAVSAAIPVSRWVWDARRQSRIIQPVQTTRDVADIPTRHQKRKGDWLASALPFCILGLQAFFGGELTRFDFGIMMFAVVLIVGNWALWIGGLIGSVSDCQLLLSQSLRSILEVQLHQSEAIQRLSDQVAASHSQNEENEQAAAEQPAISTSIS